jgi:pilus assembly protein CpaE
MSAVLSLTDRAKQAIFCVCADEGVVNAANAAALAVNGAVSFGEFRDYITAEKRPQFSPSLKGASSCVALIDFDQDPEQALRTAERLHEIFLKRISIIAVCTSLDAGLLRRAMRAGCAECLTKPVDVAELSNALTRFHQSTLVNPLAQSSVGSVIALFGAKGGVGTTTLAVHLATYLVRHQHKKTLLIDHKHQLGHVALYLGLQDTLYHFDELMLSADRLDTELLNGFVVRHPSGLDVIASPETAVNHHESKRNELERVMEFLRREYDYVLIDSSVGYQESKVAIVEQADQVYLISTPDVASLRDLARLVEGMSLSDSAMSKLRLVINRSTANDSLSQDQIQKAVRFPVFTAVANSYGEVVRAINEGEPVAPHKNSLFTQQLLQWSARIVGGGAPAQAPAKKTLAFWRK